MCCFWIKWKKKWIVVCNRRQARSSQYTCNFFLLLTLPFEIYTLPFEITSNKHHSKYERTNDSENLFKAGENSIKYKKRRSSSKKREREREKNKRWHWKRSRLAIGEGEFMSFHTFSNGRFGILTSFIHSFNTYNVWLYCIVENLLFSKGWIYAWSSNTHSFFDYSHRMYFLHSVYHTWKLFYFVFPIYLGSQFFFLCKEMQSSPLWWQSLNTQTHTQYNEHEYKIGHRISEWQNAKRTNEQTTQGSTAHVVLNLPRNSKIICFRQKRKKKFKQMLARNFIQK